jgi:nicotinamidase-related amidase
VNLIENLKNILSAARSSGIKVVYVPHHLTEKGDVADWKFLAPTHQGSLDNSLFEKGSWGGDSTLNSCLKAAILFPKTIGLPVVLQI